MISHKQTQDLSKCGRYAQRQIFREQDGKGLVWGKKPTFIRAKYQLVNAASGKIEQRVSLLLASGWWGIARHFQYALELTAAW